VSSIVTEQGILHYETFGRGQPVILLHGWINSWDVWRNLMITLGKTGQYRVYALDFWGFGDSSKDSREQAPTFQIDSYVKMVAQFMDRLGIQQAPIFGHSMGGTVALQFALRHPDRLNKVGIVGSPIVGRTLHPFLQLAGYGTIARLIWRFPFMLHTIMYLLLAKDSIEVRGMISRDVKRTSLESFFRSIGDLRDTDLRAELATLTIPIIGIFGRNDNIVSPQNARTLAEKVPTAQIRMMAHSRHFPMSDEPELFVNAVTNFLAGKNGRTSQINPAPNSPLLHPSNL
jgi:pimeloyl-ACP methyl ester carboxylesterase